jgi:hypothetical protein
MTVFFLGEQLCGTAEIARNRWGGPHAKHFLLSQVTLIFGVPNVASGDERHTVVCGPTG